MMKPPQQPPQ
jgi:hypothetical protein